MHDPAPAPGSRQLLVVAGSGRSGTSLFTGLVGRLGMHVPQPEVVANSSNPRGFCEPRWLVDHHHALLASVDVTVEDGRPEAWELTDAMAGRPEAIEPVVTWLEEQFALSARVVLKDPRLGWFIELHRVAARRVGAELRVATMLRHPAEVLRSRQAAYGTRMTNTTRVVGWMTMMLGVERRTRDLPRATVRYDDLVADWREALAGADATTGLRLLEDATPEQLAEAAALVDPGLYRATADWDGLGVPPRTLDLLVRVHDAYGRLVGTSPEDQRGPRAELDALRAELSAYYDECADVSRSRAGALARAERRRAFRRARAGLRAQQEAATGPASPGKKARARLRRSS
jgi:hypothetical protein